MQMEMVRYALSQQGKLGYAFRREDGDEFNDNCYGLVRRAAMAAGVFLPDLYWMLKWGKRIEPFNVSHLIPFDLILAASRAWEGYTWHNVNVMHVYIFTGADLVHLGPKVDVQRVSLASVVESPRFRGALRLDLTHAI